MRQLALIVEPNEILSRDLRHHLEREGFLVEEVGDGAAALAAAKATPPDIVLAEWALPSFDGLALCRALYVNMPSGAAPFLLMTARNSLSDKVHAYERGVDDYLVKPIALPEMIARVRAMMRRAGPGAAAQRVLTCGDLTLDVARRRVTRAGRDVWLGPMMFRILHCLMGRPGYVFSRDDLLKAVWGASLYVEPRTIDVHIRRLRQALNAGGAADVIRTVRAAGYAFDDTRFLGTEGVAAE